MIIFLILLNVFVYVLLYFVWRWYKNTKVVTNPLPVDYSDGWLYYKDYEFDIPFCVCTDIEPKCVYYKRRGRIVTKVLDYGKYVIEVRLKPYFDMSVVEIYHTHIVPQYVKCRFNGSITKTEHGYKCLPNNKKAPVYLHFFKVHDEKVVEETIAFSVYDRVEIVCGCDENCHKRYDTYATNYVISPPCRITTPDARLDEYLNFWAWDELGNIARKDFNLGVVVCSMKMCYTKEGVDDFLKIHLLDSEIDIVKKCLIIRMLCEYMYCNGRGILSDKLGTYTLFDYVIGILNRGSIRVKNEGKRGIKMYISAVSEFINFVESSDLKLKLYNVMNNLKTLLKEDVKQSNYLGIYFSDDSRAEVKEIVSIMDKLSRRESVEKELKRINPLHLQKPMTPISKIGIGLLWRVVVHDVFGIRKVGENLDFKPCFPKSWERVSLDCLTGTGVCKIDFLSAKCNLVKVDGVTFTGGVVPKGLGKGGKIEVYFSK